MNVFNCLLLIDDDHIATYLNKSILKKLDLCNNIETAYNGQEGLEKLLQTNSYDSNCPGLIFLDINMPVMNGFEFMEAFNQADIVNKKFITIVVLTSSENEQDLHKMFKLGITHYLIKPLTEQKVKKLISGLETL